MKRNSLIRNSKFSENWPLNFGLQNVTYMVVYLVGHDVVCKIILDYVDPVTCARRTKISLTHAFYNLT